MRTFYHVTPVDHSLGSVLTPGRFGAAVRSARVRQSNVNIGDLNTLAWESALEVARQCLVPNAPSRLNCVFATPTIEEARQFQQRYRNDFSFIFELHVASRVPIHIADFESITTTTTGKTFLDTFVDAAMAYWICVGDTTLREVIIGGEGIVAQRSLRCRGCRDSQTQSHCPRASH
jgi:hypothetical protein